MTKLELFFLLLAFAAVLLFAVPFLARRRDRGGSIDLHPPPAAPGTQTRVETVEPEVEVDVVGPPPRLRDRLSRASSGFSQYLGSVLSRSDITDETWLELEEALIRADTGVELTESLLSATRTRVKVEGIRDPEDLLVALKAEVEGSISGLDRSLSFSDEGMTVWLFVGVNGVGKTTTIGKVAHRLSLENKSVLLAAGDTFRAAAAEQLTTWAERTDAEIVRGAEGADPSSVVFDAIESAVAKNSDIVLADTAGRLHTKTNLMAELTKVRRVAEKGTGTVEEVLLVIDATTGQNGLIQAAQFADAVEVTGVILTKLDGSAKGGIVLAIQSQLGIPVKLVGVGEQTEDLLEFEPHEFVEGLFALER
ncbi:MAG: signal recognition particle-docking protein FtsY [Acidimicrobiales bacterium]